MRRTILWFLFGIVIILAGIVLWPEREPDIYRLEKRTGPEADEAIKLVREACKEFPRIGEKKLLQTYALVTDAEPVRQFVATFSEIREPDFERAKVFSPIARDKVFYVEFPVSGDKRMRVIVERFKKRLVMRECAVLE